MAIIKRKIQFSIEKALFKGKVVIIYGARQVGKTTLVKAILQQYTEKATYFNCDEPDIREQFTNKTSTELQSFIGDNKLIILDEAQRIKNIGLTLKLLVDNFPWLQIIATGSSSFDLSNEIVEPLTGRKFEFCLYPIALNELASQYSNLELDRLLEKRMVYGMYPEIVGDGPDVETNLKTLARSYLYKDILAFQNVRNSEAIEKLLQALALQIGNEVSYNELATLIGVDKITIANYIDILEKAFIIFRLGPFRRNLMNELKRFRKIYFFDTGFRNSIINNLNPLSLRADVGQLWENFIISERLKFNQNSNNEKKMYFWRTRNQKEIDYLEEAAGKITAMEFKWKESKLKIPAIFLKAYPESDVTLINKNNYHQFVGLG